VIDPAADLAAIASVDGLFRDAVWQVGGVGEGTAIRVLVRRPDQTSEWSAARLVSPTIGLTVPVGLAPGLAADDTVTLPDTTVYVIVGVPIRDPMQATWRCEARVA
jgi:hypothetical protein